LKAELQDARSAAPSPGEGRGRWIAALLGIALATFLVYAPVAENGFVTYDDPEYIYDNPHVRGGLSLEGMGWAFSAFHSSNWHPVTWLSHMLDCQLFGLEAGSHHLVSVALHALNAALLFLLLAHATRRFLASLVIAGLFALHPLRVESVAWASERKDLLCALALFLLCFAYARHRRTGSLRSYLWALALFAIGLAAKPMLVSVPVLLLILDRWPLSRKAFATARSPRAATSPGPPGDGPFGGAVGYGSLLEKIPFFLLSAASIGLTLFGQAAGGSLRSIEALPIAARLSNAVLATTTYLTRSVLPLDLAYFHPHPALTTPAHSPWSAAFFVSLIVLAGITAAAVLLRRRHPYLLAGWLWYLVMLAPVVGIVQVGEQAWAERYAYLPLIGVYTGAVLWVADVLDRRARWRPAGLAVAAFALIAAGVKTRLHVATWRDSRALYSHALDATHNNYAAHHGLANVLSGAGDRKAATEHHRRALAIYPGYAPAHFDLGLLHQEAGELEPAIASYRLALRSQPGLVVAHLNLGSALASQWQASPEASRSSATLVEALAAFEKTIELAPDHPDAFLNLGGLSLMAGRIPQAVDSLERAAELRGDAPTLRMLGLAYLQAQRHPMAARSLERSLTLGSPDPSLASLLADLLATCPDLGDPGEKALRWANFAVSKTLERDPKALEALAAALARAGDFEGATDRQQQAIQATRGNPAALRERLDTYSSGRVFQHVHGAQ
jgi:tetratricopeptide (TPR) repeat protein